MGCRTQTVPDHRYTNSMYSDNCKGNQVFKNKYQTYIMRDKALSYIE